MPTASPVLVYACTLRYNRRPAEWRMRSDDLKHWQAARVNDVLRPTVAYLGRLKRRMEKRGFPLYDRLMHLVTQAQVVMQDLSMELRYVSCKRGVGRKAK